MEIIQGDHDDTCENDVIIDDELEGVLNWKMKLLQCLITWTFTENVNFLGYYIILF